MDSDSNPPLSSWHNKNLCWGGSGKKQWQFESTNEFFFSLAISKASLCPSTTLDCFLTVCERCAPEMSKPSDSEQQMAAGSIWWSHAGGVDRCRH